MFNPNLKMFTETTAYRDVKINLSLLNRPITAKINLFLNDGLEIVYL